MTEFMFIYMLLIHYLGDFTLQTHEQALGKSSQIEPLFLHVGMYILVWFIALLPVLSFSSVLLFIILTFIAHAITDAITSRIAKHFFEKKDYHNGFAVVGMDQILHYLQLYYTFKLVLL